MRKHEYTLIVESNRQQVIENAFKKAEVTFKNVSPIFSSDSGANCSFVIAPDASEVSLEQFIFEVKEQQDFINWCEGQNVKAHKKVLDVKRVNFGCQSIK